MHDGTAHQLLAKHAGIMLTAQPESMNKPESTWRAQTNLYTAYS